MVERFKIEDRAESNKVYYFCYRMVLSRHFTRFINLIIIMNTVILSLDKYPPNPEEQYIVETLNNAFTGVFIFEMAVKLLAFGVRTYFKDSFNIFDCIIVVTSFIDLVLTYSATSSSSRAITAFRAFRLLRIFKLAKSWKKL